MRGSRDFHQLDESAQKSPLFGGFVGCARLFQQPARGVWGVSSRVGARVKACSSAKFRVCNEGREQRPVMW
jgi:hypothetical protein